jgi:hypothetical protein
MTMLRTLQAFLFAMTIARAGATSVGIEFLNPCESTQIVRTNAGAVADVPAGESRFVELLDVNGNSCVDNPGCVPTSPTAFVAGWMAAYVGGCPTEWGYETMTLSGTRPFDATMPIGLNCDCL